MKRYQPWFFLFFTVLSFICLCNLPVAAATSHLSCDALPALTEPDDTATPDGCEDGFFYTFLPDRTISILSYSGTDINEDTFQIPAELNGIPVTAIGKEAFQGKFLGTTIILPDTIKRIQANAFSYLPNVREIQLPASLETIDMYAFCRNSRLEVLTLPENLTTIQSYAFYGCRLLKEIQIPESVNFIGENAFSDTAFLKEQREQNPMVICSNILIDGTTCTGDIVIPDTVVSMSNSAFAENNQITSVTFPEQWTSIPATAFTNCQNLERVQLPTALVSIEGAAFSECYHLQTISFPEGLRTIGSSAFVNTGIREITLPTTLEYVGTGAFRSCPALSVLTMLGDTIKLGKFAFAWCTSLEAVQLCNLENLPESAFFGCEKLQELQLPETLQRIGESALSETGLTAIEIPASVTEFAGECFCYCESLESVTFENPDFHNFNAEDFIGTPWYQNFPMLDGMRIVNQVLLNYTDLDSAASSGIPTENLRKSLTIPEGVVRIGRLAFEPDKTLAEDLPETTPLETIVLPDSVRELGYRAFSQYTPLLTAMDISHVEVLEEGVFYRCSNLQTLRLPESITAIPNGFAALTSLTELVIPERVTQIGSSAFSNCRLLSDVILPETLEIISSQAFCNCESLEELHLPQQLQEIGTCAFSKCGLAEIVVPERVTTLESGAFLECPQLQRAEIAAKLRELPENLFMNCIQLEEMPLWEGLEVIGTNAFENTALKEIRIPSTVTTIGMSAFHLRTAVAKVQLPRTVTEIGDRAFGYRQPTAEEREQGYASNIQISGFEIMGYAETAAMTYAEKHGFSFLLLDGNGNIIPEERLTMTAVIELLNYYAKASVGLQVEWHSYFDVDADGEVGMQDVVILLDIYARRSVRQAEQAEPA